MSIKVYCSSCKAGFTTAEKHAGKKTKCPMCGRQIEIPALPSSTDSASHNPSENQSGLATKASALENEKQNHTWSVTNPTVVFGVVCVSVTAVVVFALIWNLRTPHSGEVDSPPDEAIAAAAISPIARDAQKVLKQHCYKCHGENGVATSGLNVLKWEQLTGPNGPVVSEAPDDSNLFEYMVSGDMPPEDDDRVKVRPTAEEIAIIRKWILAGAPSFEELIEREFISTEQMLEFMQSDLRDKIAQRDRRYIRYFTLTHLYNAGVRDDDIQTYRLGLSKLVNSLSWNRGIVIPKPIDPNKTIFRIDLRDYDWDVRSRDATVTVWDMIIAQCPYNVEQSYPAASYCSRQTGHKIPYVRGDWFVAAASRPPVYHQILDIPRTDKELETRLGVNVAANIGRERVDRAGFTNSGVSDNNRLIERHQSRYGAYWKSYDFAGNKGRQLLTRHPLGPGDNKTFFKHDGGEIIFNLPNGLQAYMLVKADGQRIDKGPTNIVKDPDDTARDGGAVVNGISCMHCHDQGMKRKDDEIRPYALANPVVFRNQPGLADFIKALYPVKGAMDRLFDEDAKMHILAAEKSGSLVIEDPDTGKPKLVDAQPVVRLATQFHNELDLELAAAEAGIRPDRLTNLIDQSKILAEQIGLLKIPGKTIKRDTYDAAVAEIIRGLGIGIYGYSIHLDKATNYFHLALYDKVIVESTKAIELDPTSTMAYFLRGSAYGEEGEYDKAIIDYAEAIRVDPNYAGAYTNRGLAYYHKEEYVKAIADCTEAIRLDPNDAYAYYNRGNAYDEKGETDKAIADYTEAIRIDPNYADAYFNRGVTYFDKEEYDKAIADYTEAIRLDPNDAKAYYNRGVTYFDKEEYDKQIADYTEAIRLDPNFALAYNSRGLAYGQKGKYDKAIADYTEAIRIDPNDAKAYYNRGIAYGVKGEHDKAIADYSKAIRIDPNDAKAYYNRGIAYGQKGEYDKEIADWTEAIRLNPNFAEAYYNRGFAYHEKREYDQAIIDYSEAIRIDPNDAKAYYNRGIAYGQKGEYDKEIADWTEAIRLDPNVALAYYRRGIAYGVKGEHDKAIADYSKAIRIDPNDAKAYYNRGIAYYYKEEYVKAIADYTEVIRLDPNVALAYYRRGSAYSDKEEYDKAIADYTEVIRLDPNFALAYISRGSAYSDKEEYDTAIVDYTEAIRLDPNEAFVYYSRGNVYEKKGEFGKAIADYTEMIRLDPNDAGAYISRGNAYVVKGKYDKAIADYTEAIRLDPNEAFAYRGRGYAYQKIGDKAKAAADYAKADELGYKP